LPPSQRFSKTGSGVVAAQAQLVDEQRQPRDTGAAERHKGLPFDEEAKLIYGVVFSLRNMVKKLSKGRSVMRDPC
jgi:trafficking protein particle complex subunit 1